ncbi:MAG: L-threonylcarbamoyladenylate synthase [Buchananella hordeovulneris]|nr:L-threonylcarbamoyladenylate synthase [Buchananella hordeovulneris]
MEILEPTPAALEAAAEAVRSGGVIALPTDTVYGIGADPFSAAAVTALLAAKGRGRNFPPPVLIADVDVAPTLVSVFPPLARRLAQAFWPGALTLILPARPEIDWDLGETNGTVALRVPDDVAARELLAITGPLAVTSANLHGQRPATTAAQCAQQLGQSLALVLDGGERAAQGASTILDLSGPQAGVVRVVRAGALTTGQIARVLAGDAQLIGADGNVVPQQGEQGGGNVVPPNQAAGR